MNVLKDYQCLDTNLRKNIGRVVNGIYLLDVVFELRTTSLTWTQNLKLDVGEKIKFQSVKEMLSKEGNVLAAQKGYLYHYKPCDFISLGKNKSDRFLLLSVECW